MPTIDSKHYFNVIFDADEVRVAPTDGHISTIQKFDIFPIYWATMVIPGTCLMQGYVNVNIISNVIFSASTITYDSAFATGLPNQNYAAYGSIQCGTAVGAVGMINSLT